MSLRCTIVFLACATHLGCLPKTAGSTVSPPAGEGAGAAAGAVAGAAGGVVVGGVAGLTVGALLSGLMDRVSTVINQAQAAGEAVAIRAGGEAYIAISNAQAAYNDMLHETVSALDRVGTHNIQQLQSMVDSLERRTAADLQRALQTAQTVSNILPLTHHEPQMSSFSPRFVATKPQGGPIVVTINGNFFHASQSGFLPTLIIGDNHIKPSEVSTSALKFSLPADVAKGAAVDKVTTTEISLEVPFRSGLFKRRNVAKFRMLLGTLPPAPGRVTLTCTTQSTVTDREHHASQSWQQHSSNDDLDSTNCGPDHPGWRIVDDSVRFVVEWSQGDENDQWSKQQRRVNPSVCYFVHTVHHRFGTSGKVNWHYEYDIVRQRSVPTVATQPVELGWGDSKAIDCPANGWKLTADDFLGAHAEFMSPGSTKYIEVRTGGAGVEVRAKDLSEIEW